MTITDYSRVGQVFDGDNPTGVNLRNDPEFVRQYHLVRDARSTARSEDRSLENPVVIDRNERETQDDIHPPSTRWKDVHDLAQEALETRTKDIELLAWLAEGAVRVRGFEALAGVLEAMNGLLANYFPALHSIDDESISDRVAPLAGLNGSLDSDGTLIRPLRLSSLSPASIYGRLSLWSLDRARKSGDTAMMTEFQQEFARLDGALFQARRAAVASCRRSIAEMDASLTASCGADGPSFGRIKDVLDDIDRAYTELSVHVRLPDEPTETAEDLTVNDPTPTANGHAAPQVRSGQIADREQAFRQLLEIAAFFRRTEPHSTIPMAIETLVNRGRMDFMGLLAELIPDDNQRRDMLTRAGIKPLNPGG